MKKSILVVADSLNGTGHQRRAETLIVHLLKAGHKVIYISSKKILQTDGCRYYSIPRYANGTAAIKKMRLAVLGKMASETPRIDIILFEHFPFGKLYLSEEFEYLHGEYRHRSRFYCLYRDIIDSGDEQVIERSTILVEECFDGVLVFSDERFLPLPRCVAVTLAAKLRYLGYLDERNKNKIVVFGGGGLHSFTMYHEVIKAIKRNPVLNDWKTKLFAGSMLDTQLLEDLIIMAEGTGIRIIRHCADLFKEIVDSNITISTLGYNTFVDLLKVNNYNIVIPLDINNEQAVRAREFQKIKKDVHVIYENSEIGAELDAAFRRILKERLDMDGLRNFMEFIGHD